MAFRLRSLIVSLACALLLSGSSASAQGAPLPLRTEFLMMLSAELEESQMVGDTPLGSRRIVYVRNGSFAGPALKGTVLPGGGDWVLLRDDGASSLDVRITLRTEDGALIYVTYGGVSTMSPEVRARIIAGEVVNPSEYYFRTTPRFETASEKYAWLNKVVAVGVGQRTRTGVVYSVYAVK
jgi:hypothetical protein